MLGNSNSLRGSPWQPLPVLLARIYHYLFNNTIGFHNVNLRIFKLRVSNPDKLIVDVFSTRCRISMCQGLGPKEHDEISEIDRNNTNNNNNSNIY